MLKLLLVVVIFAVATYLITRAMQERTGGAPMRRPNLPKQFPKRPQQRRPVAPDDDEEFLRDLERKRRHRQDPEA